MISVGSTGRFTAVAPYNQVIHVDTVYDCISVERITEIIRQNRSPYESIYEPYGLDIATYEEAIVEDTIIIGVRNDQGEVFYIPEHSIEFYQDPNSFEYIEKALVFNIGSFPKTQTFNILLDKLKETIDESLGIESESITMDISPIVLVDSAVHETVEDIKSISIPISSPITGVPDVITEELTLTKAKLAALEAFVIKCNCECGGRNDTTDPDDENLTDVQKRNKLITDIMNADMNKGCITKYSFDPRF